jgi:PAS domain S-box-containing protein
MPRKPDFPEDAPAGGAVDLKRVSKGGGDGLLRVLTEDFQRLAERSQDAIYRLDIEAQAFTFWNRRFLELYGAEEHGAKTLSVKGSFQRIHPRDREKLRREREASLRSGGAGGENEYRHLSPDGSIRWMHDKWTVIRDDKGSPVAIEGFIRDNTRRKEAEEELEKSRRNALIGSYIVQKGVFVYVNPEFRRITGYSREELTGARAVKYIHEDYVKSHGENSRAMLRGERTTPYAFCIRDRQGAVKWVMETVTPILHEGRRAVLGYFMDITGSREAEEERKEKEKLQAVLELAGAVGHELNNPLQVALVCSGKLESALRADRQLRHTAALLRKNVERMLEITGKFQGITRYAAKDYLEGKRILDLESASGGRPGQPQGPPRR